MTVRVSRLYESSACSSAGVPGALEGADGSSPGRVERAPSLANCGNSSTGSTSLVGWKHARLVERVVALDDRPAEAVPSKPVSGSATPSTDAGSAMSVRVYAPR